MREKNPQIKKLFENIFYREIIHLWKLNMAEVNAHSNVLNTCYLIRIGYS